MSTSFDLDKGEPVEEYFKKLGGLDYAFDCIGNQAVIDTAYNSLSPWGALTIVGQNY